MITNCNENKNGKFLCENDFFFYLVTNAFCVTFRQYEVSNVEHKQERKHNDQEHEPVALHQLVSRLLQDDIPQSCKCHQRNFVIKALGKKFL